MARECGFSICRTKTGKLTRGKTHCGTKDAVIIPNDCPAGAKRIALTHNHPSGNPNLSSVDKATAGRHNIIVCVKTRDTRCYRVRK